MILRSHLLAGTMILAAAPALAAPDLDACSTRGPTQAPLEYKPVDLLPDGKVVFRLCAPEAASARVVSGDIDSVPTGYDGGPQGLAMTRDDRGYWAATTAKPVSPGVHVYGFSIAGTVIADPQSQSPANEARGARSTFYIPSPGLAFGAYRPDIAHGVVSTVEYASKSTDSLRRAQVYTPPGYEGGGDRRYPVLYLVHGVGDSELSWVQKGRAAYILDNLIADGKAPPMIVVMPFGHTPGRPGVDNRFNSDFRDDLINDLIPAIDARFRTEPRPARRAMAGLSMGGLHTINFGLTRPDIFGPIGIFSIGFIGDENLARFEKNDMDALRRRAAARTFVYYTIGKTDPVMPLVGPTRRLFDAAGLKYQYVETEGGHEWSVWRADLRDFATKVFPSAPGKP
ncbi:alpha/beta hydrolase-fold protein [Caulobacter segnis]|nr:alpha/beta hydrolase-fold protein [Caulobacter segnis]